MNLSDKIIIRFDNLTNFQYYTYVIEFKNSETPVYTTFYQGHIFTAKKTYIDVYLNDIIQDYRDQKNILNDIINHDDKAILQLQVKITIFDNRQQQVDQQIIDVFLNTNYPFKDYEFPYLIWDDIQLYTPCYPYLQGLKTYDVDWQTEFPIELKLVPKYPLLSTEKLSLTQIFQVGQDQVRFIPLLKEDKLEDAEIILNNKADFGDFYFNITLSDFMQLTSDADSINIDGANNKKMFEFDKCPADFYVQWIDRFGGVQCQPFAGKETSKIQYDRTNVSNQYNEKRPFLFKHQSIFELNTSFINENLYPLYESLFVSPFIKLYDTKNDKSYFINITDKDFTEKTWKNQHKLFNLSIKAEEIIEKEIRY